MTKRRFFAFALTAVVASLAACAVVLVVADLYAHRRFDHVAGVNIWGYRGPVAARKGPGQIRIVALGGSTVLNFGLPYEESFPHQLEIELNRSASASRSYSVVNLGFSNEGAYPFQYTLADYDYLRYDVAILYEGYNDLSAPNRRFARHESAIFRWTGYYPLLPMVAGEKVMQLRSGDIHEAYRGRVVFRPTAVSRTKAALLEASLNIARSIESAAARPPATAPPSVEDNGCSTRWQDYCHGVAAGIDAALARHSAVIVASQPYLSDLHRGQQRDLREMIARRYGSNPRVRYVDLGDAVDLTDPTLCWDGMHLLAEGNARIARGLKPAVVTLTTSPMFVRR